MSNRLGILLAAGIFFIFASVFLIIAEISKRISENKIENFQGEVEGVVLEVIKSGKDGIGGKLLDTFVVYQYEVNKHKYIVKPLFLIFGSKLNQKYHDSEDVTCITYRRKHGGTSRTKYREGESIIVKYDIDNPKKHEILNDKDKLFVFKVAKIGILFSMLLPIAVYILTFFIKD